jgi:PTH1 family peptidyl-tRNA hydrolase
MFRRKPKPEISPEWLIVGLGNPGGEYRGTRHNVGFEVVDRLAAKHRIEFNKGRHRAVSGAGKIGGVQVALAKPLTFMNLSGQAVAAIARQYGLKPERILVIADDMDLVVGRVRLKPKGSAGGHNGHKSIIQSLGSEEYPRLKIGIGQPARGGIDHVLSGFDQNERPVIDDAVRHAVEACEAVTSHGVERAMSMVNLPQKGDEDDA